MAAYVGIKVKMKYRNTPFDFLYPQFFLFLPALKIFKHIWIPDVSLLLCVYGQKQFRQCH